VSKQLAHVRLLPSRIVAGPGCEPECQRVNNYVTEPHRVSTQMIYKAPRSEQNQGGTKRMKTRIIYNFTVSQSCSAFKGRGKRFLRGDLICT